MQNAVYRIASAMEKNTPEDGLLAYVGRAQEKYSKVFATDILAEKIHRMYMQEVLAYYVEIKQPPPSNYAIIVIWAMLSHPKVRDRDIFYCMHYLVPS